MAKGHHLKWALPKHDNDVILILNFAKVAMLPFTKHICFFCCQVLLWRWVIVCVKSIEVLYR